MENHWLWRFDLNVALQTTKTTMLTYTNHNLLHGVYNTTLSVFVSKHTMLIIWHAVIAMQEWSITEAGCRYSKCCFCQSTCTIAEKYHFFFHSFFSSISFHTCFKYGNIYLVSWNKSLTFNLKLYCISKVKYYLTSHMLVHVQYYRYVHYSDKVSLHMSY